MRVPHLLRLPNRHYRLLDAKNLSDCASIRRMVQSEIQRDPCLFPIEMRRRTKKSTKESGLLAGRRPSTSQASKPRLSIIGAGRLGTALGLTLKDAGYRIEVVVANHSASARRMARLAGTGTLWLTSRQLERLSSSEYKSFDRSHLILIATPDDAIAMVARRLAELFKSQRSRPQPGNKPFPDRRIAIHVSGALSSEALRPLRSAGFAIASLHPLVSISDAFSGAKAFRHVFFCIEGDRPAARVARSIVRDLGGQSFTIAPKSKPLYHAAAVLASGHMLALFDMALEMLRHCGLSPSRARQALLPLVKSTLANLSANEPARALTGSFARGDIETIKKHLAAMKSQNLREALAAYILLGRRSLSLAQVHPDQRAALDEIARILARTAKASVHR